MATDRPLIIKPPVDADRLRRVFNEGGVIAYPTETFYALGVNPFDTTAVTRLFALKGRSFSSPIALVISDTGMLSTVAAKVPGAAARLIEGFWPGPLTIVFNALPSVPPSLVAGTGTIGVRVSASSTARSICRVLGSPLTATSANPAGSKPPVTPAGVLDYFDGSLDVLVDGGELSGVLGSTIVDVSGEEIRVVREGEIPSEEVFKALS